MPQSKERHAEWMKKRRQGAQTPEGAQGNDVHPTKDVHPVNRRQELRVLLADAQTEYGDARAAAIIAAGDKMPDFSVLKAINARREPLFEELHKLEADMPAGERYWMPARFLNEGLSLTVEARKR